MMAACRAKGCFGLANAAGCYCDMCDRIGPDGKPAGQAWSRSRDEAWIGYKTGAEINALPMPRQKGKPRMDQEQQKA